MHREEAIAHCKQAIAHLLERIEQQQAVVNRHRAAGCTIAVAAGEDLLDVMNDTLIAHANRLQIHVASLAMIRSLQLMPASTAFYSTDGIEFDMKA